MRHRLFSQFPVFKPMRHSTYTMVGLLLTSLLIAGLLAANPAAAQAPHEDIVSYGFEVPGAITSPNGVEHFFVGCAGETVNATVTTDGYSPRIELYAPGEELSLESATASAGVDTVTLDDTTLTSFGLYTVVVSGRSRSDRGDYTLTINGTGPDNPAPFDGTGGVDIVYGESLTATLVPTDAHTWHFRGCGGDQIHAEIVGDDFAPLVLIFYSFAEAALVEALPEEGGDGVTTEIDFTVPSNGVYSLYIAGATDNDAGDYTLTLSLEGRATPTPGTPPPGTPVVISELTPTPTPTAADGPRPRRSVPTPKGDSTPTPTAGPTATFTPTPTPEYIMPGIGESAFRVLDVSTIGGPVNYVAYSPDGSLIATAGEDGAVRVWDAFTGELVQTLEGHENRINYVDFAPNDELIASAADDGSVRLWDQAGRQVALLEMPANGVNSVEFSPDSALLVAATDAGDVWVWDVAGESVSMELGGHQGPSYHAIFSPDGSLIASGDGIGVVRLWDVTNGELVDSMPVNAGPGSGDPILSIAFNSDGTAIVVGGVIGVNRASVQIWDVNLGDRIGELAGHSEWGSTAAISPDDAYIFSAGRAEPSAEGNVATTARIWNTETGALAVALVGYQKSVITAVFRPDGEELLTSDGLYVYIWPEPMLGVFAATFAEAVGVQVPTPEVTPTPEGPRPTATPTATRAVTSAPTPTLIPTATLTPTPFTPPVNLEIFCTVITDRLNLRPGPGTNFNPVIQVLEIGELLVVTGRNEDGSWLQVDWLDANLNVAATGWVSADFVFCIGEIEDAPVVEVAQP